jgi:hypothetical protein
VAKWFVNWLEKRIHTFLGIVPGGFEPPSTAPKAVMIGHYTTGLRSLRSISPVRIAVPSEPLTTTGLRAPSAYSSRVPRDSFGITHHHGTSPYVEGSRRSHNSVIVRGSMPRGVLHPRIGIDSAEGRTEPRYRTVISQVGVPDVWHRHPSR